MKESPNGHHADPVVRQQDLWRVFGVIGISSFGGGMSGWIYREIVERRRWMSAEEFLTGLALARTMPGPNVMNLSIWIGYQLRGGAGALAAGAAVIAGPFLAIVTCASAYHWLSQSDAAHQTLLGVTAAALGLSLSMAIKSLRAAATSVFYGMVAVLTFIAVALLHWPILPVFAVSATVSVGWSFFTDKTHER